MSVPLLIEHAIDVHIMTVLSHREYARFSDFKDNTTDTNLLTYHLKKLQAKDFICKSENMYMLGQNGLAYIYNLTKNNTSPKVSVMLLIQNSEGDVLLQRQTTQPYIDTWTLPQRAIEFDDTSLIAVASKLTHSLGSATTPRHVGDAYLRIIGSENVLMSSLMHVFRFEADGLKPHGDFQWVQPHRLPSERLAPGIMQIITRSFFDDALFFEEFDEAAIV